MKKIIIIISIVLFLGAVVVLLLINNNSMDSNNQTAAEKDFTLVNTEKYSDRLNATFLSSIQNAIYDKIEDRINSNTTGVIRDGSIESTSDKDALTIQLIVDIASLKESYVVSYGSDSSTGESSLYILCPDDKDLIYPKFECVSDAS